MPSVCGCVAMILYDFHERAAKGARPGGRPRPGAVAAAEVVRAAGGAGGALGVILGTGLGGLAGRLTAAWSLPAAKTGWLAASTATGHAGRIACGTLYGTRVVALEGRVHGYEGRSAETLIRGVELLAALGVETLLITNAAGGLRPDMRVGEIVVVSDHVDFVRGDWTAPLAAGEDGADGADGAGPPARGCYDDAAAEVAVAALAAASAPARRGVYAFLRGPSYETRAEYRMLRRAGADVVGMSTVPEVAAAAALGMRVVVCSVVTNVANPDAPGTTDAEDVCRMAAGAGDGVWAVLGALARRAAGVPTCGSC